MLLLRFCRLCEPTCAYGSSTICPVLSFSGKGKKKKKPKKEKKNKKKKGKKDKKEKKETDAQRAKRLEKEKEAAKKEEARAAEKAKREQFGAAKKALNSFVFIGPQLKPKNYSIYFGRILFLMLKSPPKSKTSFLHVQPNPSV